MKESYVEFERKPNTTLVVQPVLEN